MKGGGFDLEELAETTVIIDDSYLSRRILYVDDRVVAEDTQNGLVSSADGLYIGTDKST